MIIGLFEEKIRPTVTAAIEGMRQKGDDMFLVPQVVYEFWVVATRPAKDNGLGLTTQATFKAVNVSLEIFTLAPDTAGVCTKWLDIVSREKISGKPAHDARLVAAMEVHKMEAILTRNAKDFRRHRGIKIISL